MPELSRYKTNSNTRPPRKVAAVIQFTSSDIDRVNEYLSKLSDKGIIVSYTARSYDPALTSPELYFP